jgi:hypothetical protein
MQIHNQLLVPRTRARIIPRSYHGRHRSRRGIVESAIVLDVAGDGYRGCGLRTVEGGGRGVGDGGVVVVGGVGELDYFVGLGDLWVRLAGGGCFRGRQGEGN